MENKFKYAWSWDDVPGLSKETRAVAQLVYLTPGERAQVYHKNRENALAVPDAQPDDKDA